MKSTVSVIADASYKSPSLLLLLFYDNYRSVLFSVLLFQIGAHSHYKAKNQHTHTHTHARTHTHTHTTYKMTTRTIDQTISQGKNEQNCNFLTRDLVKINLKVLYMYCPLRWPVALANDSS